MRRRLLVAVGLVALCSAGAWAERLATVEVLLNERSAESSGIDQTLLHRLIRIRPGRNCTREEIDRDFVALLSTGLFDPSPDASYRTVGVGPGGLSVEFRLTPNPTVTGYRFRGATAVPAPVLIDAASRVAPLGRIYDVTAGSRLGRELAELYQRQDVEAHVDTPAIGRDGSVSATVHEHRIGRISVEWVGTPLAAQPDRLVARTGLRRLDLVRPSACAAGREALLATGLFESVTLSLSPPDQADLVELRFELRPSRMPRPGRPDDLDLVDPAALAGALRWHEELRAEAPFDLTPPLAPAGEARLAREGGSRGAVSACASALDRGDRPAALAYARSVTEAPPPPHPAAGAAPGRGPPNQGGGAHPAPNRPRGPHGYGPTASWGRRTRRPRPCRPRLSLWTGSSSPSRSPSGRRGSSRAA